MTIFKMEDGKVAPVAIVKNGETKPFVPASEQEQLQGEKPAAEPKK